MAEKKLTQAQMAALVHAEYGKCVAMIPPVKRNAEPHPCTNWATPPLIRGRGYCGVHAPNASEEEFEERHIAEKKAELDLRLDDYIDWAKDHPSVWDRRTG